MSSSERQRSRQRTRNLFVNTIKATLKKPEKLTVSQWAEKYRILDESSNFSGQWSNDITPYLVGIMDAFNDPYIQEINFCKPTQVGGTEAMQCMDPTTGATGYYPVKIVVRGKATNTNLGKATKGKKMEPEVELEVMYIKIQINNKTTLELDKLNFKFVLNGKDMLAKIRSQV